ncbi:MAG: tetratricopeptide repeat protein [Candidatus Aegiribacteria sp.]|nr:tetratricopeptide repeat protein [Candidatus Aegiribacteria sp.]
MFTDVVGFTSIMEQSEKEAMRVLSQKMRVVRELVTSCGGQLIKEMGDGTLSVFSSPPDAVSSALDIQDSLEDENFTIRIGIHCGSVLFKGDDIFGDAVNVASRLEKKAPGGGILVSREVLSYFSEKDKPKTISLGMTRLKGLGRLLQIHFLGGNSISPEKIQDITPIRKSGPLVLSVFPLVNKGRPEDEFYAYGVSADLLGDLAKANSISVVPVTSLLRAMKSGESNEDIARRFGSSILVKGTIARTGSQMELSLTLKEVESDRTVWMDSWVEEIDDLPAIKGKLADGILKALGKDPDEYPGVTEIEVESVSIYEKYLQALQLWQTKKNKQDIQQTRSLLYEVINSEPEMIPARVILGATYRDSGEYAKGLEIFKEAQEIAVTTNNPSDLLKVTTSIGILHWMKGDLKSAQSTYTEAMQLAKQLHNKKEEANLLNNIGLLNCDRSLFDESLADLQKSLKISTDLGLRAAQANTLCNIGLAYWRRSDGVKAIEFYEKSLNIVRTIRDQAGEANLLRNLGIIFNDRGEIEKAYSFNVRSMELSRVLDDKSGMSRALNNMGNAMLILGQNEKAEEYYSEALLLARQIGLRNIEGIILANCALLKIQMNEILAAKKYCETSLGISQEVEDRFGIMENSDMMASIHIILTNYKEASNLLQNALELSDKYQISRNTATIRTGLALSLVLSDSSIDEVLIHLRKAQSAEIEDVKSLPDIYWKWSRICADIAENTDLLPGDSNKYREEAEKWKKAAKDELLRVADRIQSNEFRQSFLNQIPLHRTILNSSPLVAESL